MLTIVCNAKGGSPPAIVTWKSGQINLTTHIHSASYQFKPTRKDDLQIYTCVSESPAQSGLRTISGQLFLNLKPFPLVVTAPSVTENSNLTAQCLSAGSRPPTQLAWSFRGIPQNSTELQVISDDAATKTFNVSSHYVVKVERSDNGLTVECEAKSTAFTEQFSNGTTITVWFGPDSLTIQGVTNLLENTTLHLRCTASLSNPAATISWTKNGKILSVTSPVSTMSGQYGGVTTQQNYSVLARREDNLANITCRASATARSATKYVILNVKYRPTVEVQPQNQIVIAGDLDIRFVCQVKTANPAVQSYRWNKGTVTQTTKETFVVAKVSLEDAGNYSCTATNEAGQSIPSAGNLEVLFPPVIDDLKQQNIEEGSTLTVNCNATSNPYPSIVYWTMRNDPQFRQNGSTFVINNIQRGSSDVYTCHAENIMKPTSDRTVKGNSTKFMTVNVLYGPGDTVHISPESIVIEENITQILPEIKCTADCYPVCYFTWSSSHSANGLLSLGNVTRKKNGTYTCTARNSIDGGYREASKQINVLIFYGARITNLSVIGGGIHDEQSNVSLICEVDSYPLSGITWINEKGNVMLEDKALPTSVLRLVHLSCIDTGYYTCSAFNGHGVKSNSTTTLIVKCYPRLLDPSEGIVDIGIGDDENLNISAVFMAYPEPNITWYYRKNSSEASQMLKVQPGVLKRAINIFSSNLIKKVGEEGDLGEYIAIASNDVGSQSSQQVFKVDANQNPKPVEELNVSCLSHSTANVSWIPGFDGGPTQAFRILYKSSSEGSFFEKKKNITEFGKRVRHYSLISLLKADTLYTFKVRSINIIGYTDSQEVDCKTTVIDDNNGISDAIIGSASGVSAAAILIIIIVVVFVLHRRHHKNTGERKGSSQRSLTVPLDGDDGVKDNALYVSAESSLSKTPEVYSQVQKKMVKTANGNNFEADAQSRKGIKDKKGAKRKERNQSVAQDLYENVEGVAAANAEHGVEYTNTNKEERGLRNKDGLLYVEVEIKPVTEGRRNIIIGEEDRTDYASVDFTTPNKPS